MCPPVMGCRPALSVVGWRIGARPRLCGRETLVLTWLIAPQVDLAGFGELRSGQVAAVGSSRCWWWSDRGVNGAKPGGDALLGNSAITPHGEAAPPLDMYQHRRWGEVVGWDGIRGGVLGSRVVLRV
jgi:hypothetical protein